VTITLGVAAGNGAPLDGTNQPFTETARRLRRLDGKLAAPPRRMYSMISFRAFLFALLATVPIGAFAQNDSSAPASEGGRQFDFLLGQWELDVHVKTSGLVAMIHGTPQLSGTWKAWRAIDGRAIEDELRIVDASGNPLTLDRALRFYSPDDKHWKMVGIDLHHNRSYESVGQFQDGEMRVEGHSTTSQDKQTLNRTRYTGITADAFHLLQERSTDGGATWEQTGVSIDAKRIAAVATPD
jgi:hypothetical protein